MQKRLASFTKAPIPKDLSNHTVWDWPGSFPAERKTAMSEFYLSQRIEDTYNIEPSLLAE